MGVGVRSYICVALDVCPRMAWQQKRPATPTAGHRQLRATTTFTHCCEPAVMEYHIGPQRHGYASEEPFMSTAARQGPRAGTGGDTLGSPKILNDHGLSVRRSTQS